MWLYPWWWKRNNIKRNFRHLPSLQKRSITHCLPLEFLRIFSRTCTTTLYRVEAAKKHSFEQLLYFVWVEFRVCGARRCKRENPVPSSRSPHRKHVVWHLAISLYASTLKDGSKHVLNAQVSIRAPCCKEWFDCAECHAEKQSHNLAKTTEMTFICKKCKKAFRKDTTEFEESDEYCPHCDNHFVSFEPMFFGFTSQHDLIGAGSCNAQTCVKGGRRRAKNGCEVRTFHHLAAFQLFTLLLGCSKTNARRSTQAARSTIKIIRTDWGDFRSCRPHCISRPNAVPISLSQAYVHTDGQNVLNNKSSSRPPTSLSRKPTPKSPHIFLHTRFTVDCCIYQYYQENIRSIISDNDSVRPAEDLSTVINTSIQENSKIPDTRHSYE